MLLVVFAPSVASASQTRIAGAAIRPPVFTANQTTDRNFVFDQSLTDLKDNQKSTNYPTKKHRVSDAPPDDTPLWSWHTPYVVFSLLILIVCSVFFFRRQVRLKTVALQNLLNKEKQLHYRLQISEEKFRRAFHTSPDSINLNSMDGTYLEINDGFCKTLGYTPEEVIGKTSTELNIWEDVTDREKLITGLKQTGRVENMEAEFTCKDGSIVSGLMSATLIDLNGEPHILSITRNISTYKKQQEKLLKAKQRWQHTFDAIADSIIVRDADMKVLQANKAAREFFNPDDLDQSNIPCFPPPLETENNCADCPVTKTFADGQFHSAVIKYKNQGKTFMVTSHPIFSPSNTVVHVVEVARDISEHLAMEQDHILLTTAIDQSSETIIITGIDGNIQYVNPAFEEQTGYSRSEVLGANPRILNSDKHDKSFYHQLWTTILSGRTWHGKLINQKKNGTLFTEKATISPVFDKKGALINFIAVKRDITHEQVLEQQLQQAQKLEAIGTLAGGIAHDFNNILGAILGFAEMARIEIPETSPAKEDVGEIIVAGQRAVELVKQILTFSRQDNEKLQPVKVQSILKETFKLLKASLPSTIHLQQQIDTSCKPILGNSNRLHQVILNICTNAKHALGEKQGQISISLQQQKITWDNIDKLAPFAAEDTFLELAIADNGCGMDQQTLNRIFDPFFTTKPKEQGTGLGLSVTHGIIKQHGGEIKVTSSPGEGTTFHIYLPTIELMPEQLSETPVDPLPGGNEHIILVDDEKFLVEITERMLTNLGYTVTPFTDAVKALSWMKNNLSCFDLLITDITMPELTGMDLTKQLLALRPQLPIIFCTGFSETMNKKRATTLGIRSYLMKPVAKRQLAKTLHKVLHP